MKKMRALLIVFLLLGTASCAGPFRQTSYDARESYRSPNFNARYNGAKIALLTATNGDGFEYKKLLGDFVQEALRNERPDINIVPYWQSLNIINTGGHTAEYADMLKEYSSTGILDMGVLKKLSDSLDVTYFLQPRLINFQQGQSTRFSAFGLTLFKTHESTLKIYIELWNGKTGEIVWIGVAETTIASEHYRAKPVKFEEVARFTIRNLVKKMP